MTHWNTTVNRTHELFKTTIYAMNTKIWCSPTTDDSSGFAQYSINVNCDANR